VSREYSRNVQDGTSVGKTKQMHHGGGGTWLGHSAKKFPQTSEVNVHGRAELTVDEARNACFNVKKKAGESQSD